MNRQSAVQPTTRAVARRRYAGWVIALLVALLAMPVFPAQAAPAAQAVNAEALLLGQYGFANMTTDETRTFVVDIPEDGSYLITAVDDVAAEDFDLIVIDANGDEVFNDIFATTELVLSAGPVTLEFVAVADNLLAFVVVGELGAMSSNESQPGKLVPGGVYVGEDISEAQYGAFTVPATSYPQQVLIYLETGAEDTFYLYVEGDSVYEYLTTDTGQLIQFWTHGGDFTLYADPYDRRSSLTVIIFLSGPPQSMSVGVEQTGTLQPGTTEAVFALPLEATYGEMTVEVESDASLELRVFDRYTGANVDYYSYGEGIVELYDMYPGVYYVMVQADEPSDAPIAYTLYADGDAGRPIETLPVGQVLEGEFLDGEELVLYAMEITQAGAGVTVTLNTDEGDTDFDLAVGMRPGVNTWSRYRFGSDEIVTFMAPVAGTYYVSIFSNGDTGAFELLAEEGDLVQALETNTIFAGEIEDGERISYRIETTRPDQLLTVTLVGSTAEDLDLLVIGYDAVGNNSLYASGYRNGSVEIISDVIANPGLYEVVVDGTYASNPSLFFIEAQVVDPHFFGGQWAVDAAASSQYGEDGYSAQQATGAPDTPIPGDRPTAWAPANADGGLETLELAYAYPVNPAGVAIYETSVPGAVVQIEAYDLANETWVVLWQGEAAPIDEESRIFMPEFAPVDFITDGIRLTLDTSAVPGWNEIDAVQLFGRP